MRTPSVDPPEWWHWELELPWHIERRMEDRDFTELDLRAMLEHARAFREDAIEGRYAIFSVHRGALWKVIVEPDVEDHSLVVVTAYPLEPRR